MRRREKTEIKALSIAQPWAELILRRRQPIEIRSWTRGFRGLILIHASATWRAESARELGIRKEDVSFGAFVGVARVADIRPFTRADVRLLRKKRGGHGGWEAKQYAWVLESVHRLNEPVKFKGRLGLFSPPPSAIKAGRAAIIRAERIAAKAVRNRAKKH